MSADAKPFGWLLLPGHLVKAEAEVFSNASVIHLEIDGIKSAMIYVPAEKSSDAVHLTFGDGVPKPIEFSEMSMVVAPPMADGDWPRMKSPCTIPDEASIDFDESDLPSLVGEQNLKLPRFRGSLKRDGLRISYSMMVERGETWQGELSYAPALKSFNLHTDVQGWHVFRGNSYVESLPIGKPVPLISVLAKRGSNDVAR